MAGGYVNRANRPNTWLHRPSLRREDSPCQLGAVHTWHIASQIDVRSDVRSWELSGTVASGPNPTFMTQSGHWQSRFCCVAKFLFDHLVGACKHARRYIKAERLRGLHVEHGLIFCWCLHRRSAGLPPLEEATAEASCPPVRVGVIRPIGDQAASGDVVAFVVDRGQFVPRRQREDQIAIKPRGRARRNDETAV